MYDETAAVVVLKQALEGVWNVHEPHPFKLLPPVSSSKEGAQASTSAATLNQQLGTRLGAGRHIYIASHLALILN